MKTKIKKIKLSLLENAESFASEGIQCAIRAEKQSKEWKFAILHIVQAIELVLKEILRREHESFIYENIDNPQNTVSLLKALTRISKVSENEFTEDDIKKINRAVSFRNKFTHSSFEYNTIQMKSVFADMFSFLQHCYTSFLRRRLEDFIDQDLWLEVTTIEKYANSLYLRVKKKLDEIPGKEICPRCYQDAFVLGDEKCLVCGHSEPVYSCSECACPILGKSEHFIDMGGERICDSCNFFSIEREPGTLF